MFTMETEGFEWLDTRRQKIVYDAESRYVSLNIMMSTPRQVPKIKEGQYIYGQAAEGQELSQFRGKGKVFGLGPD